MMTLVRKSATVLRRIFRSVAMHVPAIKRLSDQNELLKNEVIQLKRVVAGQGEGVSNTRTSPATLSIRDSGTLLELYHPSIQREAASKYHHFLVVSWGHCASIWFAGSLNLHPEILCNTGIDHPIQSFIGYKLNVDSDRILAQRNPDDYRYGATAATPLADGTFRPGFELPDFPVPSRDRERLPWYVFDEMEIIARHSSARFVGNVHGLTLPGLAEALKGDPSVFKRRRFPILNLIRHPVPRTESAIKATMHYNLESLRPDIDRFINEHLDDIRAIEKRHKVDFSEPRDRAALHVFRQGKQNVIWAEEIRDFPDVKMVSMEMLQSNRDYFATAFNDLTSGMLIADHEFLDRVFTAENLGSGRRDSTLNKSRPPPERDQYEMWSDFERAEFGRIARNHNLHQIYGSQNYDLSFVAL